MDTKKVLGPGLESPAQSLVLALALSLESLLTSLVLNGSLGLGLGIGLDLLVLFPLYWNVDVHTPSPPPVHASPVH